MSFDIRDRTEFGVAIETQPRLQVVDFASMGMTEAAHIVQS